MRIQFKLEASSNNDPNTSRLDKGCNRRGRMNSFKSQFVDTDEEVDEANHIYKKALQNYEAPPMDSATREELQTFVERRKHEGGAPTDY